MSNRKQNSEAPETKRKLVDAGVNLMRAKGFNATTVDEICSEAGVTKGGFFHYFKSKEDIAQAALLRFREGKSDALSEAPFRKLADPLDRVFGRLDFVIGTAGVGATSALGCLVGMFAQELSSTHPELRGACQDSFLRTAEDFARDLKAAKLRHAPKADFDPDDVALFYVSILQGSIMLAKVAKTDAVLISNLENFRRYLQCLFGQSPSTARRHSGKVPSESRN